MPITTHGVHCPLSMCLTARKEESYMPRRDPNQSITFYFSMFPHS